MQHKLIRCAVIAVIILAAFVYPSAAHATGYFALQEIDCNHIIMFGRSDAYRVAATVALVESPDIPLATLDRIIPWKDSFWVFANYSVPSYSSLIITAREYTETGKYVGQFSYYVSIVCPEPIIP